VLSKLGSLSFQDKCVPKLELGNEERLDCARSLRFQQLKRFGVAAALEEMAELRINPRRQGLSDAFDFLRYFAEAFGVAIWIGAALLVADDGETLAERLSEGG
jgi:hypothetical protein